MWSGIAARPDNLGSVASAPAGDTPFSVSAPTWSTVMDRPLVWWSSLALMFTALLVPLLTVAVPPLTDYPNHLARCYVLAFGNSDPVLHRMFSAHWQIIPNIGVDLLLPALMRVFAPLIAGKIMLALCLLLPASGAVALSYAYFRQRSFWQIAAGFAAFNALFLMGFMNFEISIGIALWGAAGWIAYREKYPIATVLLSMLFGTLVFFFHLFGFCLFALLIGSYEMSLLLDLDLRTRRDQRIAATRVVYFAEALLVPVILYAASPLEHVDSAPGWPHLGQKVSALFVPFLDYSSLFDIMTAVPVIGFLIACLIAKRVRLSRAALICCSFLLLAFAIVPRSFKGVYFVDTRLPVMMGFMLFAGFLPRGLPSRRWTAVGFLIAALFVARIGFITSVWVHSQRDIQDVREVISSVTPGSRVMAADVVPKDNPAWFASMPMGRRLPELTPTYWHLASFVLLDRRAFWETIFSVDSQQPIRIEEPYRDLRAIESPPPNYISLATTHIPAADLERFPFLVDWSHKFDYVLILNAEGAPGLEHFVPEHLRLISRRGIAALFKVVN
jgi:hypothetical protein